MRKLFTCLYGSNLYGTQTPESDRDVKHIVLPDLDELLLGQKPRNVVNKTNTEENQRNQASDVDEEFIPLQVFARDFLGGQTYAIELAFAVEGTGAEQEVHDPKFWAFVRELREKFLTSDIQAMVGYSVKQASKYSEKGDRLNCALEAAALYKTFPANDFVHLHADALDTAVAALARKYPGLIEVTTYDADGRGKYKPCVKLLTRILPYSAKFIYTVGQIETIVADYGARAKDAAQSTADWKATMHAVRVLDEACDVLSGLPLSFPLDPAYVQKLLQIRRGEIEIKTLGQYFEDTLARLTRLGASSPLQRPTPELRAELDVWLVSWLKLFYTDEFNGYAEEAA